MEKGADDSRDSGHHRGHLGDCDSALHHRGSVLLPAAGTRGLGPGRGTGRPGCRCEADSLGPIPRVGRGDHAAQGFASTGAQRVRALAKGTQLWALLSLPHPRSRAA